VIQNLSYPEKRAIFHVYLDSHQAQIAKKVSRHLNIPLASFPLGEIKDWSHGSFNAIRLRSAKLDCAALDEFGRLVMPYWHRDAQTFVADKVRQQGRVRGDAAQLACCGVVGGEIVALSRCRAAGACTHGAKDNYCHKLAFPFPFQPET
jgi:hypothetical protein